MLQNFGKGTRKCARGWVNDTKFWKRDKETYKGLAKYYKFLEKEPENVPELG